MNDVEIMPLERVNFAPANEREEIIQNVATILSTMVYTVPYDRDFGINPEFLDDPSLVSRSKLIAEIVAKIKKHEPRAKIISVQFAEDALQGKLTPKVRIDINGQ